MGLYVTIPANWKKQTLQAVLWGLAFVAVNFVLPQITIGFPILKAQAFADNFFAVVLAAPLIEELVFRLFLLNFLYAVRLAPVIIVGVTAAAFSIFHYSAYGASFAAQNASFVGAFLFGIVVAVIALRTRSIVYPIVIHATLNLWLLIRYSFNI